MKLRQEQLTYNEVHLNNDDMLTVFDQVMKEAFFSHGYVNSAGHWMQFNYVNGHTGEDVYLDKGPASELQRAAKLIYDEVLGINTV